MRLWIQNLPMVCRMMALVSFTASFAIADKLIHIRRGAARSMALSLQRLAPTPIFESTAVD